jgi:hypothetical protein
MPDAARRFSGDGNLLDVAAGRKGISLNGMMRLSNGACEIDATPMMVCTPCTPLNRSPHDRYYEYS